jgi:1-acyl-sn-glycerol-3-phosphate acyltransferase
MKPEISFFERAASFSQLVIFVLFILPIKYVFKVRIKGLEKIAGKKPVMVVANHQSMWDAFVVLSAMGLTNFKKMQPWRSPITKSLYRLPWVWIFSKLVGLYKIEPKGELDKSLESTYLCLDKNYSVFFFPEGKMVPHGQTAEPKKGIARIIETRDLSLQTVKIIYSHFNSKGRGRINGAQVIFGDVLDTKDLREKFTFEQLPVAILEKIKKI